MTNDEGKMMTDEWWLMKHNEVVMEIVMEVVMEMVMMVMMITTAAMMMMMVMMVMMMVMDDGWWMMDDEWWMMNDECWMLNVERWMMTNEWMMHYAWMMAHLHTQNREQIQVKTGNSGHKWLGCILGVGRANRSSLDLQHHLQAASRAFFAHKQILCDQRVRVKDRFRFYSCCYVRLWASHCLSIRFRPHGCVIPQAASYVGGSSGLSGLVSSMARDFARVEHEGSDNRKWTSSEIMVTPLFRIILEVWIIHC